MEKKNISKESKEVVYNKEISKNNRVVLFLLEVEKNKNLGSKEIERLYLEKYNLSNSSNKFNIRVIERSLNIKNSNLKEEEVLKNREVLKNELKKINIDYNKLVNSYKEVKEKLKRSNRIVNYNNIKELENLL